MCSHSISCTAAISIDSRQEAANLSDVKSALNSLNVMMGERLCVYCDNLPGYKLIRYLRRLIYSNTCACCMAHIFVLYKLLFFKFSAHTHIPCCACMLCSIRIGVGSPMWMCYRVAAAHTRSTIECSARYSPRMYIANVCCSIAVLFWMSTIYMQPYDGVAWTYALYSSCRCVPISSKLVFRLYVVQKSIVFLFIHKTLGTLAHTLSPYNFYNNLCSFASSWFNDIIIIS